MNQNLRERAQAAAAFVRRRYPTFPSLAVILGSGLGEFVSAIRDPIVIPYPTIPHFPTPTVAGHHGNLVVGSIDAVPIAAFQGRFHTYEGFDLDVVTFPVRLFQALGGRTLILTAATGGIRESLCPGDLICLSDHLNLIGANPLRGPNDDRLGPRFPDMSEVYSRRLRRLAAEEAGRQGIRLGEGVYAALPGPSYETPAEIRMLRTLGADVVGMSTVPEALVARHAGIEVLALALVTNAAAGVSDSPVTHEEVLETGRSAAQRIARLIGGLVARIS
jgi:purine-nucleoside phosphorylase